jgi:hypothetical protein
LTPLCFLYEGWWLIHSILFVISFIFFFSIAFYVGWGNLGGLLGCDYLSYGLVLLRF